jgi:lipopolysaccharide biosynthesis glycosyltransferase
MVLVCAADDNYAMPMAVMLYSALRNYRGELPVHIYILDGGILERHEQKIRRVLAPFRVTLHWFKPDLESVRDFPLKKYLTATTYLRLFISDFLPDTVEKVIYLDCDLLVCRDLAELWAVDVGDNYVLAARNIRATHIAQTSLKNCPYLQFSQADEYFNAGILVMNMPTIRKDHVLEKAIAFGRDWPLAVTAADQDPLNAVCIGRWGKIDQQTWNSRVNLEEFFHFRPDWVLHFGGRKKPWLPQVTMIYATGDESSAHRLYDRYLAMSGWFSRFERLRYVLSRASHRIIVGLSTRLRRIRSHLTASGPG